MIEDMQKDTNESTYIDISVFIESGETPKRRLCFCGYISDFPSLEDADEPPVAVAVVHPKEAVTMVDIRLSVYGCGGTVEGVCMEREEEPQASSSVCSSCSSPCESSYKTERSSSSVQVTVAASTCA